LVYGSRRDLVYMRELTPVVKNKIEKSCLPSVKSEKVVVYGNK